MALLAQALAQVTAPLHLPPTANFQGLDLHHRRQNERRRVVDEGNPDGLASGARRSASVMVTGGGRDAVGA